MLVTLIQEPTMTQRALSIYLGISEAAVQKTIKSLASTGLVAKTKVKGRNHYSVNVSQFLELPDIVMLSRVIGVAQEVPF
jgi:predicted transcriptional regulator